MRPKFAPWIMETMAERVPGHGYITVTVDGAEIEQRQLVQLPRMFNGTTVEVGWPPGKGEYRTPDGIAGAAELVIYRNESGPEWIMAMDMGWMRGGDRMTIIPQGMRMARLEQT